LTLRELPKAAIDQNDQEYSGSGTGRTSITAIHQACRRSARATATVPAADQSAARPSAPPAAPPLPACVQAFLTLCQELDAATERFRRETARWTGERRAQRRLTIWQTVQHLSEQLEWMQEAEATRHEPSPA
jgi:hypothetical protein